ncbi:hypothetical protein MWU76_20880 [Gelidibacter sp. F2691]|nr:hypothetical protein [Gelidibacter sp. F2691]
MNNYLRCLAHLALHYKQSPETLSVENIEAYLYHCQKLHKTPVSSSTPFLGSGPPTKSWAWRPSAWLCPRSNGT